MELATASKITIRQLTARKAQTAKQAITRELYRACRQSDLTWRYLANLRPWLAYHRIRKSVSVFQDQLLAQLKRDGIVITSVEAMLGHTPLFSELDAAVWKYESSLAEEIYKTRLNVETFGHVKSYLIALRGPCPLFDPEDIFVRFALQPEVLSMANGYFGMLTKLRYYNAWHNLPMQGAPRESQLWHRDPEDRHVLKMFVYLTDVDEGAGPLNYAPGTHPYGWVKSGPASSLIREGHIKVRRSDDAQMNAIVPRKTWITATGPKGTVVLVDTRGYHKGGLVRGHDRILYTCMFTSQASTSPEAFERRLPLPRCSDRTMEFAMRA